MSIDELTGRMVALEVIAMTALGMYLANSENDPDMALSRGVLDHMRELIAVKAEELSEVGRVAAIHYADDLLSQVLENLPGLRGKK